MDCLTRAATWSRVSRRAAWGFLISPALVLSIQRKELVIQVTSLLLMYCATLNPIKRTRRIVGREKRGLGPGVCLPWFVTENHCCQGFGQIWYISAGFKSQHILSLNRKTRICRAAFIHFAIWATQRLIGVWRDYKIEDRLRNAGVGGSVIHRSTRHTRRTRRTAMPRKGSRVSIWRRVRQERQVVRAFPETGHRRFSTQYSPDQCHPAGQFSPLPWVIACCLSRCTACSNLLICNSQWGSCFRISG